MAEKTTGWTAVILAATERLGFPIVIVTVLLFGGFRGAAWLAEHVVEPLSAKHLETMAVVQENTRQQTAVLTTMQDLISTDHQHGQERSNLLGELLESQRATALEIHRLVGHLEKK